MSNIALIGPKYLIAPLSSSGIDTFYCDSSPQGEDIFNNIIVKGNHTIVFITEQTAMEITPSIKAAEDQGINVVLLPDHRGGIGLFNEDLDRLISKATGAST
ncbi:MAG: V-type ATP synthase subunit F [bacterium]